MNWEQKLDKTVIWNSKSKNVTCKQWLKLFERCKFSLSSTSSIKNLFAEADVSKSDTLVKMYWKQLTEDLVLCLQRCIK